jgi:hypothetical protein
MIHRAAVNIPDTLGKLGIPCEGADLVDRAAGKYPVRNFFTTIKSDLDTPIDIIISNPPYGIMESYVRQALFLTRDRVIILARLAFLEGQGRAQFFAETPLARVWVSRRRISMPPGGTDIKASGGSIAYAWFVWEIGHCGPTTVGWV